MVSIKIKDMKELKNVLKEMISVYTNNKKVIRFDNLKDWYNTLEKYETVCCYGEVIYRILYVKDLLQNHINDEEDYYTEKEFLVPIMEKLQYCILHLKLESKKTY